jgi:hypothetical protein
MTLEELIELLRKYEWGRHVKSSVSEPIVFETYSHDNRPIRIQVGEVGQSLRDLWASDL